ncbi:hypothetical protein L7F22_005199 [Adiantum nelumboides]|nr:hypothetical protein [Adiantum nelumboides]
MVVRLWATSLTAINRKVRQYLGWNINKPAGGLILCRTLKQRNMHTFRGMAGYCMKDCNEVHFEKVDHNITADNVNEGIELHSLYGTDALKNKVCLTLTNVFDHCLMFWKFKLNHPSGNRESMLIEGDVANTCDSSNEIHEDIPDFRPGDPYFSLVHSRGMNAIAVPRMDEDSNSACVEATQEGDLAVKENNCPLSRLHDVLCEILIELRVDSSNEIHEDIPDFRPGDPYFPLVHSRGMNAIAVPRMDEDSNSAGVEATQEGDLAVKENNCPLSRLHDVLCEISIELRDCDFGNAHAKSLEASRVVESAAQQLGSFGGEIVSGDFQDFYLTNMVGLGCCFLEM